MKVIVRCVCFVLAMAVVHGCPHIVERAGWGARPPKNISILHNQPVQYAFIHHSHPVGPTCHTRQDCKLQVKRFQDNHMDTHHRADISFNFLVGGDGSIFEGRGWDRVGTHTFNYNSVGLGICLIGNFNNVRPTNAQLIAARQLLACAVSRGKLNSNYTLKGHRDMGSTGCPGTKLYQIIRKWRHYRH